MINVDIRAVQIFTKNAGRNLKYFNTHIAYKKKNPATLNVFTRYVKFLELLLS